MSSLVINTPGGGLTLPASKLIAQGLGTSVTPVSVAVGLTQVIATQQPPSISGDALVNMPLIQGIGSIPSASIEAGATVPLNITTGKTSLFSVGLSWSSSIGVSLIPVRGNIYKVTWGFPSWPVTVTFTKDTVTVKYIDDFLTVDFEED